MRGGVGVGVKKKGMSALESEDIRLNKKKLKDGKLKHN